MYRRIVSVMKASRQFSWTVQDIVLDPLITFIIALSLFSFKVDIALIIIFY